MHIVIMGCGRVGSQLAKILTLEGHDITIIDKNPEAFERLPKTFTGKRIHNAGTIRQIRKIWFGIRLPSRGKRAVGAFFL